VLEDDRHLADVLRRGPAEDGYLVDVCSDGTEAAARLRGANYDAAVLDVMLPGKSGLEVCREARLAGVTTPILMLTARDTVDDIVSGLEAGADDYLRKPFAFRELRARLQSITRRSPGVSPSRWQVGDLVLEAASREIRRGDQRIALTNREYQVLAYLAQHPGRILTRTMIFDHVWGNSYGPVSNAVDVHIKRLREKLDEPGQPSLIETIRSVGYRLTGEHR
jgi:DNA-binding response OmpR family regulator